MGDCSTHVIVSMIVSAIVCVHGVELVWRGFRRCAKSPDAWLFEWRREDGLG